MNNEEILEKTVDFVKQNLTGVDSGHDWYHIVRVWNLAKHLAKEEPHADLFIVELGTLLHDIADRKFNGGDKEIGLKKAREFLTSLNLDPEIINHVEDIVRNVSFSDSIQGQNFKSKELDIIQDADRLDAIGAIGIARAFTYGGFKNQILYDPENKPRTNLTGEEYKKAGPESTLNHFYEKILLLKAKMNTPTGKRMAEGRHDFILKYLDEFYKEWDGEL